VLAHPVRAVDLLLHCALHVLRANQVAILHSGPVVGLTNQIPELAELQREAIAVRRLARRALDDLRDGPAVEGLDLLFADDSCNDLCVGRLAGRVPRHTLVEIDHHLEQIWKIGISRAQEVGRSRAPRSARP
jgi:hypothetical protein